MVALGFAVLVLVGLAFARQRALTANPPSTYSTYDTGRNGYRALYETLDAQGVPVSRSERELGLLDPSVKTLVETSVQPELSFLGALPVTPLDANDVGTLRKFVREGGRLVVIATDIGGEEDAKIGLPAANLTSGLAGAAPIGATAMTAGVGTIDGAIGAVFPFAIPKATPLLGTVRGTVAIDYPYGKGDVVAISAPAIFGNLNIAKADNARFAFDLLADRGPVAFDERVHGYVEDKSFWDALPQPVRWAFWIVCGIVGLALIGANVRSVPAMPLEPPDERDSSAYLVSMASLMRRARSASSAIDTFADDAMRRARRRYGLPTSADAATIATRSDRADVRQAIAELARLRTLSQPGDAALVRAAVLDARLRKDLS
jgi:hypothetical protein